MSTHLPQDLHDALDRFILHKHGSINKTEAIAMILRDWMVKEGYLPAHGQEGTPPEKLNSSNDD